MKKCKFFGFVETMNFLKIIFSLCTLTALIYTLFFADKTLIREQINELIEFIHSQGSLGIGTLIFVHSISIAFCFPATIMFEWASGYIFGVLQGVLIVAVSKTIGGVLGFTLGKTLLRDWAKAAVKHNARAEQVFEKIGQDGLKFAFLLRLSPVPSWVNNYGLAMTSLSYRDFMIATAIGSLPFIFNNVYMGSLGKSLTDLGTQNAPEETNYIKTGLIAMGGLSMMIVTKKVVSMLQLPPPETKKETEKKKK